MELKERVATLLHVIGARVNVMLWFRRACVCVDEEPERPATGWLLSTYRIVSRRMV